MLGSGSKFPVKRCGLASIGLGRRSRLRKDDVRYCACGAVIIHQSEQCAECEKAEAARWGYEGSGVSVFTGAVSLPGDPPLRADVGESEYPASPTRAPLKPEEARRAERIYHEEWWVARLAK